MDEHREQLQAELEDRYVLHELVGSGGMGVVYSATDVKHGRRVAVKVLRAEHAATVHGQRFLDEIEIVSSLAHPHVVPLFDSGRAGSVVFYVMPLLEGPSLRQVLDEENRLDISRAVRIAIDIADAAAYAHGRGVIHRDIKPANIIFSGKHALLADFGVARATERARLEDLTVSGAMLGTLEYMSPEQLWGEGTVDERSDVYSLGCVLYKMLVGRSPFRGSTRQATVAGHLQRPVPSVRNARPEVSHQLEDIVRRALAKSPDDRFQTALELGRALEAAAVDAATTSSWRLPYRARGRPAQIAAAGVLIAAVGASSYFALTAGSPPEGATPTAASSAFLVLPYLEGGESDERRVAARGLAAEIIRQLNTWDETSALTPVALDRVLLNLQVDMQDVQLAQHGPEIAAAAGMNRVAAVSVTFGGDSLRAQVNVLNAADWSPAMRPLQAAGPSDDLAAVARPIVHALVGLEGPIAEVARLHAQTSSPAAIRAFLEGRRDLDVWDVPGAESAFRTAIAASDGFALAHYFLGVSLYLRVAEDPAALSDLGPEIARHAVQALERSSTLPERDRRHITGFERFLRGDFAAARAEYETLLASDSTDAYSWLLLGSVEYRDRRLIETPGGSLRPRGSWQRAIDAFDAALRLSPSLYVGYGHLFDVGRRVTEAPSSDRGWFGFEPPSDELIALWEPSDPRGLVALFPVYRDTIAWLDETAFAETTARERSAGADRLADYVQRSLARGADYLPNEPRPHEVLAEWALFQRNRGGTPQAPEEMARHTHEALRHLSRAIALEPDTAAADLIRLANLYLGVDSIARAVLLNDMGVDRARARGSPVHAAAANVFFATGRPLDGLAALRGEVQRSRAVVVPETGALTPYGPVALALVRDLEAVASVGWEASRLIPMFDSLDGLWSEPTRRSSEIRALRTDASDRLVLALLTSGLHQTSWRGDLSSDNPLWNALEAAGAEPPLAGAELDRLLERAGPDRDALYAFVLGMSALDAGRPLVADRLFARLDSIPFRMDGFDLRWGLRTRSVALRGRAATSKGAPEEARRHYQRTLSLWTAPDSTIASLAGSVRTEFSGLQGS